MSLASKLLNGSGLQIVPSVRHPRARVPLTFAPMPPHDGQRAGQIPQMACASCGTVGELAPVYGPTRMDGLISKFRRMGWSTNGRRASKTFCPACTSAPRLLKKTAPPPTPPPEEEKPMPMPEPQPALRVVEKPAVPTPAPQPTPQQRSAIRRLLDANFDDAKGMYLDGYSDQRIGTELGVPWAMVKALREAAYGPIKSDPQVEVFLTALDQARAEVADIARSCAAARQQIDRIATQGNLMGDAVARLTREAAEIKARYRS